RRHLFVLEAGQEQPHGPVTVDHRPEQTLRSVTPGIGARLTGADPAVSPDGTFALAGIYIPEARGSRRSALVRIDLATGQRLVLADDPRYDYGSPLVAPDGRFAVVVGTERSTPE